MSSQSPRRTDFGRRIPQREIAERAGVSVSTVSRVLSDKPSTISEELKEHVKAVAQEIFKNSTMFGNGPQIQQIGLFVASRYFSTSLMFDPFYADVLIGIEGECKKQGFHLSFTTLETENVQFLLEKIKQNKIDGAIFLALDDRNLVEEVLNRGLPAVLVNAKHIGLPVDAFLPDWWEGATLAVKHLVGNGHKRILLIGDLRRWTLRVRFEAYRSVLEENGIEYDPALVLRITSGQEEEMIRQFFKGEHPEFSAIFCITDMMALQTIKVLREMGLRIPQDYSIVGFDDLPVVSLIDPPLTTVRVERQELGARAVRGLLDRVAFSDTTAETVQLACRLVERQSVLKISPPV